MTEARPGPLPPAFFLLGLLLQAGLHFLLPVTRLVPPAWTPIGVVLILGGIAVEVAADSQFKKAKTAVNPFGAPSSLVATGLFRYSRNPMYLGMIVILVGAAVTYGSLSPWLVPPVLAWTLTSRFIHLEEAKLSEIFGPAYADYCARVRRWL